MGEKKSTETSTETRRDANELDGVMKRKLCIQTRFGKTVSGWNVLSKFLWTFCYFTGNHHSCCAVKDETTNFIERAPKIYFWVEYQEHSER